MSKQKQTKSKQQPVAEPPTAPEATAPVEVEQAAVVSEPQAEPVAESPVAEPEPEPAIEEEADASVVQAAEDGKLSELAARIEAMLLASDEPLTPSRLSTLAGATRKQTRDAVAALNAAYEAGGHSFRIEEIAEGVQMLTLGRYNDLLEQLLAVRKDSKLSQAALETLAVVAYKQPVTRADIEIVRGVACGEVLRSLMEKRLVKIVGRAEILGRPMLYGSTRRFLEVFGLRAIEDLPKAEALTDPDKKDLGPREEVQNAK
ncbi:MAG: SMC-Scp complex subunit ScpB [Phycisphaerae bacterium]|nr:SMC-Scp complex subunit ScpB [Phycisphaerae bacterium]